MANVEIPPGSWGRISKAKRQADGKYKASGRFKTLDGLVLQRNRYGTTSRKAEDALLKLFQDLASEGVQPLRSEDPFGKIIEEWIIHAEFDKARFRVSTAYEYARVARRDIMPALGKMPLSQLGVRPCSEYLHGILQNEGGYAKAQQNKAVLSNIMTWAAGRGLIIGNPVRQVAALPRAPKRTVDIIEAKDVGPVLEALRRHAENPPRRPGPRPNFDIVDGVELSLATGVRISELLGLRWEDLVIDGPGPYSVSVTGTVGWEKDKGMLRHNYGKSDESIRKLSIGPKTAASLRLRRAREVRPNPLGAVFPSRNGRWLHQANWRRRWRALRTDLSLAIDLPEDVELSKFTPHTFRRTVGTHVAEANGIETAARQLGHSGTGTTVRHYVKQRHEAPDSSPVLETLIYGFNPTH